MGLAAGAMLLWGQGWGDTLCRGHSARRLALYALLGQPDTREADSGKGGRSWGLRDNVLGTQPLLSTALLAWQ